MLADYLDVKHVGGCELDPFLFDVAHKNLVKLGIESDFIFNIDACNLSVEYDSFNYFFIYNAFTANMIKLVLKNLHESWLRNKRKITLLYIGPEDEQTFLDDFFELARVIKTDYYYSNARIYELCDASIIT